MSAETRAIELASRVVTSDEARRVLGRAHEFLRDAAEGAGDFGVIDYRAGATEAAISLIQNVSDFCDRVRDRLPAENVPLTDNLRAQVRLALEQAGHAADMIAAETGSPGIAAIFANGLDSVLSGAESVVGRTLATAIGVIPAWTKVLIIVVAAVYVAAQLGWLGRLRSAVTA